MAGITISAGGCEPKRGWGFLLDYRRGLELLRYQVERTSSFQRFDLEARLLENLEAEEQFGSNENLRSQRAEVVQRLNELALEALGVSFNDLCLGREPRADLVRATHLRLRLEGRPAPSSIPPPVRTLLQELPLGALSWQQFEALCAALVAAQPGVVDCHLHGGLGDEQQGIDIVATQRGEHGHETWAYQCKRRKTFSAAALRKAFSQMRYPADMLVLMLIIHAGASLREVAASEPKGFLWDALDIARKLKNYPRIVEDFFGPAWREAFCPKFSALPRAARPIQH
jgi:hypothetical protein